MTVQYNFLKKSFSTSRGGSLKSTDYGHLQLEVEPSGPSSPGLYGLEGRSGYRQGKPDRREQAGKRW